MEHINEILKNSSRSIVGRLCKQAEILQEGLDFNNPVHKLTIEKLDLLKAFNKELVYESFRDIQNQLKAFDKGIEFYKIYNPTSEKE